MIKPKGLHNLFLGEEVVGSVFSEDFDKRVMLPDSKIFAVGTGWSGYFQSLLFMFSQMQKEDSINSLLNSLMIDLTKLLCNRRA